MVMEVELSLVLLMLFSGMGIGAAVLAALAELINLYEKNTRYTDVARWGAYLALPTLGIGLLASMFHLSDPFSFINGMLNFGSSWISREGIFGLIFLILAALYALAWFITDRGKGVSAGLRVFLAVLTAVAALCLVYSTGMAYSIVRPVPAWNSPLTLAFFAVSACTMGTLLVGSALVLTGKAAKDDKSGAQSLSVLPALTRAAALLVLVLIAVEGLRLIHLGTGTEAAVQSLDLLGGPSLGLALLRWIVGLALPALLLLYAWLGCKAKPKLAGNLLVVSLLCVIAGEAVARVLFFITAVHL